MEIPYTDNGINDSVNCGVKYPQLLLNDLDQRCGSCESTDESF